jgi:Deoxyribonuclease II
MVLGVATAFLSALLFSLPTVGKSLQCLNEAGQPVEWWAIFKLPQGAQYLYYDTQTPLALSPFALNETKGGGGAMFETMNQLWLSLGTQYAFYNDEPPNMTTYNFTVGHSKGAWMWDNTDNAVFLQHSIPKFTEGPNTIPHYLGLPSNAYMYGQHAFCLTMPFTELETVVEKFVFVLPDIYETNYNAIIRPFPALATLLAGAWDDWATCDTFAISGAAGTKVTGFAKTAAWNDELYAACMAPELGTALAVETWMHGSAEPAACVPKWAYDVLNVKSFNWKGQTFLNYDDHSKWAIAEGEGAEGIVCFSDINRVYSQYARNGAAFCLEDEDLWRSLKTAIVTDTC